MRSPRIESASTGAPFLRSRYIEEVSDDPVAVCWERFSAKKDGDGGWPQARAIAAHSLRAVSDNSAPLGTAAISPIFPRSRQVMAPKLASCTHFCHIS